MELSFDLPKPSTTNTLMDIRLLTLRTIADIWLDDNSTTRKGWQTLVDLGIIDQGQCDKLKTDENGIHSYDSSLRTTITNMNVEELERYFAIRFDYNFPFLNFSLLFINGNAEWNLYGDNQWTKPIEETITLTLPRPYKYWKECEKSEKLMEYYSRFPSILGTVKKLPTDESSDKLLISFAGNDYDLGISEDVFISFGALIVKLIATAWENERLLNQINYKQSSNEISKVEYDRQYDENLLFILKEHFNYEFPWSFKLRLNFAEEPSQNESIRNNAFWIYKTTDKNPGGWLWNSNNDSDFDIHPKTYYKGFLRNTARIEIPKRPSSPKDNVSLALANYNAIGPAYPFTCS